MLRQYWGNKKEFLKSFGGVSLEEAKRLAARERATTDDQFIVADHRHANHTLLNALSKPEIAALARNYFSRLQQDSAIQLSDDFSDRIQKIGLRGMLLTAIRPSR